MKPKHILAGRYGRTLLVMLCAVSIGAGEPVALAAAQQPAAPGAAPAEQYRYSPDQLDSLVAPIALYPDPLLAQTLAASTYPLELVQLQQWLAKNSQLKDKALVDAVSKQPWDPSIQAMAALPTVVRQLVENIKWTADLGNAFLAQQTDVMEAVQRMRGERGPCAATGGPNPPASQAPRRPGQPCIWAYPSDLKSCAHRRDE